MQVMQPLRPAVDASRRKLLDREAHLKVRVKASRPKPKFVLRVCLTANFHETSWAALAAEDPT